MLLWILPFQLLLFRWPRAYGKWMSDAAPIQAGWLINSLFQGHTEYGQTTRQVYRADLALSEDGRRIYLPGIVVDRIDVVDVAPTLGAIARDPMSLCLGIPAEAGDEAARGVGAPRSRVRT